MDISPILFWNILLTLVVAPLMYNIRSNASEIKRVSILINKTREEIPSKYVTKTDLNEDMERLFDRLDKLDLKIDKLIQG
tara:strand:+ start:371 stop:610 length:240 start_codon:yes stop_codon:yes gene_type:complete